MFKDKSMQYITIKQYDKQLKIDNQVLKNNKIIKTENSSFLIDDTLSNDAISKLNILQQNINKTYLSTICESLGQLVIKSDESCDDNYEIKRLNSTHNVAILKNDIESKKQYFQATGCDYIFSPFNILYNQIMANGANTNSLNILILNNIIYALILNDEKRIVYSSTQELTPFNDIQSAEFSDDDLDSQKLFDEIHLLEIQDKITLITNNFYEQNSNDTFCESITMFYTLKQLNDEQLNIMKETMMLEIEYLSLDLTTSLFSLTKQPNVSRVNFIIPREKKVKQSFGMWLISAILTTILAGAVLYYMNLQEELKQQELEQLKKSKELEQKKKEVKKIQLPNHVLENEKISSVILSILDVIPYDAVLNELQLQKRDSTFVCSLLKKDTYENDIKSKLLKIYKTSEILLIQENKPTYNAIVANSGWLPQKTLVKHVQPNYFKNKFVTKGKLIQQLEAFLPKDSKVNFKSKFRSEFLTYNFNVMTVLNEPKDLFKFIEELNKKAYSIQIKYPIEFAQTNKGLETTFNVQFHQLNKKTK